MEQAIEGSFEEDPGWPLNRSFLVFFIPAVGPQLYRRRAGPLRGEGLGMLRMLFISFFNAVIMFGVVLLFIPGVPGEHAHAAPWLPILVGFAAAAVVASRLVERPLDCSSDAKLAASYRSRFFVRIAFGESVALLAFVFTFIGGPKWIYYVGAAITLVYFWSRVAPTRGALVRDQDALHAIGCGRSLIRALRLGDVDSN
jgi:F0F1-type ATP synthase membrane subunit c/vacuolar-type H+-ATPase subunit K